VTSDSAPDLFYKDQRAALQDDPDISEKKMFGTTALCVGGKVFMFPWEETLVLKLPASLVEELVTSGQALLFDPGHGRTSKTWAAVYPTAIERWPRLALTARNFVSG